jgi:hypothetical protein
MSLSRDPRVPTALSRDAWCRPILTAGLHAACLTAYSPQPLLLLPGELDGALFSSCRSTYACHACILLCTACSRRRVAVYTPVARTAAAWTHLLALLVGRGGVCVCLPAFNTSYPSNRCAGESLPVDQPPAAAPVWCCQYAVVMVRPLAMCSVCVWAVGLGP